jgi:hypothetical protein
MEIRGKKYFCTSIVSDLYKWKREMGYSFRDDFEVEYSL